MNLAPLDLRVRWLGRMDFATALALQEEIVLKKRRDSSMEDQLLLLEHEPVYTIGRTPDQSSLLGAGHLPHPLFVINRGGQALTGVWVGNRKIVSIGVGVRHWITMHGFALNVSGDLSPFNHIVPCGINNIAMTSMEKETGMPFTVARVAASLEKLVLKQFGDLRVIREAQPINV